MRNRGAFLPLRWVSVTFLLIASILSAVQLVRYSRIRSNYPPGMVIAGIPVGGLNGQQASERLLQAYNAVPVEVRYRDSVIQIKPAAVDFKLNMEGMLAAADLERVQQPFWTGFWNFLWNRIPKPEPVPLLSTISEERLRVLLNSEIAARYDQQPEASVPNPGQTSFQNGQPGTVLDINRAVVLVSDAFRSPGNRQVALSFNRIDPPRPSSENLKILLQQIVQLDGYDGTIELYLKDLQTGQDIHFAYDNGQLIKPDIAFTAASTMKIPIMIAILRREPYPLPPEIDNMINLMIEYSENGPADQLMEKVLDGTLGPLDVTKDMETLGLDNTFLAGYFFPGAPLLQRIQTPANTRSDISTDPDSYNQTTPAEMGMLLEDIYYCAEKGGGTFAAVFPGQLTQEKCQLMISYLSKNRNGVLLEAGLPEGLRIAHKHGWIIEADNLMHSISDAGIVYSPGGSYVLSIYMHDKQQLLFDKANLMVCEISEAVYNYMNLSSQISVCQTGN
jgi:beta-lactamase class A